MTDMEKATEGIKLRAIEPEDISAIYSAENNSEDWWTGDTIAPYSYRQLREYAANYGSDPYSEGCLRLIAENDAGEIIGIADFYELSARHRRGFVGIYVADRHRHKGYGKKMLQAITDYNSRFLGLEILAARISTQNRESIKIFSECGFKTIGVLPRWHRIADRVMDIAIMIFDVSSPQDSQASTTKV